MTQDSGADRIAVEDGMNASEEKAYVEGSRSAWRQLFATALRELGRDVPEWTEKNWLVEREEAIAVLRQLCAQFGDNDWADDLHLADVIDKHLGKHLHLLPPQEPKPSETKDKT